MIENKFYKVEESGGTYVVATFFNPVTKEQNSCCVRDYDYEDGRNDRDDLYYMPIDKTVRHLWLRHNGIISEGDLVKVVKGRKMPIGYIGRVTRVYDWSDCYGRVRSTYAVFEDGQKTSVYNCEIIDG